VTDSSRKSLIGVISVLLGSGLVVSIVNNVYSDYIKQPHIDLSIDALKIKGIIMASVDVDNNGFVPAHNMRLTISSSGNNMSYINGTITNKIEIPSNVSQPTPDQILVKIPRLDPDNKFQIDTYVPDPDPRRSTFISYKIDAKYDEGSSFLNAESLEVDSVLGITSSTNRNLFSIIETLLDELLDILTRPDILIFVLVAICIWQLYKARTKGRMKRDQNRFVINLMREVRTVKDTFERSILSQMIFSFYTWGSRTYDFRRQIFSSYEDYKLIDKFYSELKKRDFYFSHDEITDDKSKKI
jgi:hypothetical protein